MQRNVVDGVRIIQKDRRKKREMQVIATTQRAETRRLRSATRMGIATVVKIGLARKFGKRDGDLLAFSEGWT